MPRYIRAFVPGGTFFFTVALLERKKQLLIEHVDLPRECFARQSVGCAPRTRIQYAY